MDALQKAFKTIKREGFVPDSLVKDADIDAPLPIGFGQTISQPTTVHNMLSWLEVEPGNKILDVGSGSGWTTALLAYLTGPKGHVYAIERLSELRQFGQQNCLKAGVKNASFYLAGKELGLQKFAPYDRILVSASAKKLPTKLVSQLKVGGKMVVPVCNTILEIEKISENKLDINTHSGYVFVPLVDDSTTE